MKVDHWKFKREKKDYNNLIEFWIQYFEISYLGSNFKPNMIIYKRKSI